MGDYYCTNDMVPKIVKGRPKDGGGGGGGDRVSCLIKAGAKLHKQSKKDLVLPVYYLYNPKIIGVKPGQKEVTPPHGELFYTLATSNINGIPVYDAEGYYNEIGVGNPYIKYKWYCDKNDNIVRIKGTNPLPNPKPKPKPKPKPNQNTNIPGDIDYQTSFK